MRNPSASARFSGLGPLARGLEPRADKVNRRAIYAVMPSCSAYAPCSLSFRQKRAKTERGGKKEPLGRPLEGIATTVVQPLQKRGFLLLWRGTEGEDLLLLFMLDS